MSLVVAGVPGSVSTEVDPAQVVLLTASIAGIALLGFGYGDARSDRSADLKVPSSLMLFANWFAIPVFAVLVVSTYVSGLKYSGGIAFADFVFQSPNWFASASLVAILVAATWLISDGVSFVAEAFNALFVKLWWLRQTLALLAVLALLGASSLLPVVASIVQQWLPLLLIPGFALAGILLTENLIRHGAFHEVSLKKGYAFYGRVGTFTVLGYLAIVALCFELVDSSGLTWLGLLSNKLYALMFFGAYSPYAIAFIGAVVWTLITAVPRVLKQEREIANVEERRTQIAGTEFVA
jgi:hypothetical protein